MFQTSTTAPAGFKILLHSSEKAALLNQWNAWAAVTQSMLTASSPVFSALPFITFTFLADFKYFSTSLLMSPFGSTAKTEPASRASCNEKIPVPAPMSATVLSGAICFPLTGHLTAHPDTTVLPPNTPHPFCQICFRSFSLTLLIFRQNPFPGTG